MKIILSLESKKILEENNFSIDYDKDYTIDEYLELLDDLYFEEAFNVDVDEKKAKQFARIADELAKPEEI